MDYFLMILLLLVSMFMMLIVLLQRGRGGGLAGAFGGAGGSSALGTRAGDVFTKITVVVALIWFVLAGVSGIVLRGQTSRKGDGKLANAETEKGDEEAVPTAPADNTRADIPGTPTKDGTTPEKNLPPETPVGDENATPGDPESPGDDAGEKTAEPEKTGYEKNEGGGND